MDALRAAGAAWLAWAAVIGSTCATALNSSSSLDRAAPPAEHFQALAVSLVAHLKGGPSLSRDRLEDAGGDGEGTGGGSARQDAFDGSSGASAAAECIALLAQAHDKGVHIHDAGGTSGPCGEAARLRSVCEQALARVASNCLGWSLRSEQ